MFLCKNPHFFPGRPVVSGPSGCSRCSKRAFTTAGTWSCRMTTGEETLAWPISPRVAVKPPSTAWSKKLEIPLWIFLDHDFSGFFQVQLPLCGIPWYIPHLQTHPNLSSGGTIQRQETHPFLGFLGPDPPIPPPISPKKNRSLRWGNELLHLFTSRNISFSDKNQEPRPKLHQVPTLDITQLSQAFLHPYKIPISNSQNHQLPKHQAGHGKGPVPASLSRTNPSPQRADATHSAPMRTPGIRQGSWEGPHRTRPQCHSQRFTVYICI